MSEAGAADETQHDTGYDTKSRLMPFTLQVPVDLHRPREGADGSLLVALHGMGMSARSFSRQVLPLTPSGCTVLIPQGPLPFEIRRESKFRQGNSWYVYLGDEAPFLESMQRSEGWLIGLIERYVEFHGLDPDAISLLGFSQGGYLAGYVGLRNPRFFQRVVIAGGRIKHEVLEDAARAVTGVRPDFELLGVHGEEDPSVSVDAVRASVDAIAACGVAASLRTYAAGHAVLKDPRCAAEIRDFLRGLGPAASGRISAET